MPKKATFFYHQPPPQGPAPKLPADLQKLFTGVCQHRIAERVTGRRHTIHAKDNSRWATLPSRPVLDAGGMQMIDPNGKKQFAPFLRWKTADLSTRFRAVVVELIVEHHSDAFGAP
jgi:hypothetical protein